MKRILFFTLLFVATISTAQMENTKLSWLTNLDEAQTISQTDNKPILIYFTGSDWCAPCMRLKEDFFENPKFTQQANNLVLVKIDYPRRVDIISEEQLEDVKTTSIRVNPSDISRQINCSFNLFASNGNEKNIVSKIDVQEQI